MKNNHIIILELLKETLTENSVDFDKIVDELGQISAAQVDIIKLQNIIDRNEKENLKKSDIINQLQRLIKVEVNKIRKINPDYKIKSDAEDNDSQLPE